MPLLTDIQTCNGPAGLRSTMFLVYEVAFLNHLFAFCEVNLDDLFLTI